jgi:hypothetical protein
MTDSPWQYSFCFGQIEYNEHRQRSADFVAIPEMNLRVSIWEGQTHKKDGYGKTHLQAAWSGPAMGPFACLAPQGHNGGDAMGVRNAR